MFGLIMMVSFGLVFLGGLAGVLLSQTEEGRGASFAAAAFGTVGFVVTFLISSFTIIPANEVGIQSRFGKPLAKSLPNGMHFIGPFVNVDKYSTRKQPLELKDAAIKFGTLGSGKVSATVYYRIDTSNRERPQQLWKDWREFENVRDKFVKPQTLSALNATVGAYAPEEAINSQRQGEMEVKVQAALEKKFAGKGIVFDGVTLAGWTLDHQAQGRIDRITTARADLERAKVEQERAKVEAATNALRSQNATAVTAQQRCLDILDNWNVGQNGPAPSTFNCGLGVNTGVLATMP